MIIFNPQKGFKLLLPIYGFLSLLLVPIFILLFSTNTPLFEWMIFLLFTYLFVTVMFLIAQHTTKYWINGDSFFYKALFNKGSINIHSIRKLEVNATCWLNGKPATSNTNGIYIYYNKYEDTFITPENNTIFLNAILGINPNIEVIYLK